MMDKKYLILLGLGGFLFYSINNQSNTKVIQTPSQNPPPQQKKDFAKQNPSGKPVEGSKISPDGKEVIQCDLPEQLRTKNCGGIDNLGLCVFTSIMHEACYQNVVLLMKFQNFMKKRPGGGYPDKVNKMIKEFCKEEGVPENSILYLQDTTADVELLKEILNSNRMACVTYDGHDPHYGMNQSIAHMVNLIHFSNNWAVILDNNFIKDSQLMWMSPDEFIKRWRGKGGGWVFVLLSPSPPPIPHN